MSSTRASRARRAHRAAGLGAEVGQRGQRLPDDGLGRKRERGEVGPDVTVLQGRQQHHRRARARGDPAAGAADLLVVGDRRLRRPQVDDEAQRRVEAHAERGRRDQGLDPPRDQVVLEREALGGLGLPGVRRHGVPPAAEVVGHLLRGRDREAVDDAGPGLLGEVVGQPRQPLLSRAQPHHPEPQGVAVERAAQHQHVGAQLLRDVGGDPGVGGGGGRQHGDAVGQLGQQRAQPPVVGPEVVSPVGDAVRLVDDQQAGGRGQPGQHLVAEAGVVEALGRDQQHVDEAGGDVVVDLLPLLDVGGVDGHGPDAGPLGGGDLVAHQGQERRDDHGRSGPGGPEQGGGDEVDRRLAPAGALDHQRPPPVDDQRLDRGPLVVAEPGVVVTDERTQLLLGGGAERGQVGERHDTGLPAPADSPFTWRGRTGAAGRGRGARRAAGGGRRESRAGRP